MFGNRPKLSKCYPKFARPNDPRTNLRIPKSLYADIKKMAAYNNRSFTDEIIMRLIVTLQDNDIWMKKDRLIRLITNSGLSYEKQQKKKKKI